MIVLFKNREGHRGSWAKRFNDRLRFYFLTENIFLERIALYLNGSSVCFGMVEENFFKYVFVSSLRSLFGLKTVGVLYNPSVLFYPTNKSRVKYIFLWWVKKVCYSAKTISLVPFYVDENIEIVCDDWVYDPDIWSNSCTSNIDSSKLIFEYERFKDNTTLEVIVFLGYFSIEKGSDYLEAILNKTSHEGFEIFSAGKTAPGKHNQEIRDRLNAFGMYSWASFIDEAEFCYLIKNSNYVWACYSESYNQSSGIFGHAVQFSRIPMVRAGSVLEKIALELGVPFYSISTSFDLKPIRGQFITPARLSEFEDRFFNVIQS